MTTLKELLKYRDLLYMITLRDIRVKYKQSVMGIMWAVLMPIIICLAGLLVKEGMSLLSNKPISMPDVGFILVKSIPWAFFVSSVRFSANSLLANANLITKIYFPKAIFPVAAVISQLFDLVVASLLLCVILTFMRFGVSVNLLWVPVLLIMLILFTMGLGALLSAANLFYRDVKYLVEVVLTFAIFVTPVFYNVSMFGKWGNLLLLNPVAPILEGLGSCVVLHSRPEIRWMAYSAVVSVGVAVFGFICFRKMESFFAERI
jgi:ABC-type polysaccharide/polyol phosphate export permease